MDASGNTAVANSVTVMVTSIGREYCVDPKKTVATSDDFMRGKDRPEVEGAIANARFLTRENRHEIGSREPSTDAHIRNAEVTTESRQFVYRLNEEIRNERNRKPDGGSSISVDPKKKKLCSCSEVINQDAAVISVTNTRKEGESTFYTRDEFLIDTEKSYEQTVTKESVSSKPQSHHGSRQHKKRMKKAILMSYSPDAGFIERKFVVETVRQLKENNLAEDIWFDKDEKITDNPCWFSMRMEAVEKCKAAILILSDSYFSCPVSVYEGKALLERQHVDKNSVKIYLVLFELSKDTQIPRCYNHLLRDLVDLTKPEHSKKSLAERTSVVVGSLMLEIEKHASMHVAPPPYIPPDTEFSGEYKEKKICNWEANDLQEWLFRLGIKEFYRQSLAENMVDGFLLMSLTDQDMIHFLGIDSRAARKKIMQQILLILDKEQKLSANWHLRARLQRPKSNSVYLIYDPADVRLAQSFKHDIMKKHLQVGHTLVLMPTVQYTGTIHSSFVFLRIVSFNLLTSV